MNNSLDAEFEIELVPLIGETAEEVAADYTRKINKMVNTPRMAYSKRYGEVLPMYATQPSLREIKGKYFADVWWQHMFFAKKEELFNEDEPRGEN